MQSIMRKPKIKADPGYLQLGVVKAKNKEALGKATIKHIGLGLPCTENVGRWAIQIPLNCVGHLKVARVEHWQKAWGYDEKGSYTMIPQMRAYADSNCFGIIIEPKEALFIPDDKVDVVRAYLKIKYIEGMAIINKTHKAPSKRFFTTIVNYIPKILKP